MAELRPVRAGRRSLVPREEVAALADRGDNRIDPDQFRRDLDEAVDQGWGR